MPPRLRNSRHEGTRNTSLLAVQSHHSPTPQGEQANQHEFVTISDFTTLLERERLSQPKEPRHFVRRPPYPAELLSKPYLEKYETPTFPLYDGRKRNAIEHVNKFLDSMGPFLEMVTFA
nr:hypothetical protein CFP56_58967 [Quercus suber]